MRARVTNFGRADVFPTKIGDLRIGPGETLEIEDRQSIEDLKAYPFLKVEVVDVESTAGPAGDPTA